MDPDRDLQVTRLMPAPVATLWRCLTTAEHLRRWWVPAPVQVADLIIEPHPGGRFFTHMILPDGGEHRVDMVILLAEAERRLVFTDLMTMGFVPVVQPLFGFVGELALIAEGQGTRYVATARHARPEDAVRHRDMGFHDGWGMVADQLAALARTMA
ncbi:SRPBCC domain-containing protein [Tabrizicola sp. KVB23]|uniref:SRPBCC domain-containing protein n=1 Tax=Fuscibacter oryzae TaxID=2803939 RepID=A0A8J7MUF4_9RHOB|nr:SRPBCC domain-containing protein [Fuscibacter oryzae]